MKKATLFMVGVFTYFTHSIYAQNDTITLKETVIMGTRAGVPEMESPRSVEMHKTESLNALPVSNNEDALEISPVVDVRTRGDNAQSDISIRGGSFEQTLIMLDGIPLTDPQTGHHALVVPFSFLSMGSIETYAGGASGVYGPKAFSGAINFVSPVFEQSQLQLSSTTGDYGLLQTDVNGVFVKNNWTVTGGGGVGRSNGYAENTDYENYYVNGGAGWRSNHHTVNLFGGYTQRAFGAHNFYSANFSDQYERIRTGIFTGKYRYRKGNFDFKANGYYRQLFDKFELFREGAGYYNWSNGFFVNMNDTAPSWYSGPNFHLTHVAGGTASLTYTLKRNQITIGGSYRREEVKSNVLGELLGTPESVPGEDSKKFTKGTSRNEFSVYAEDQFSYKKWLITGGAYLNFHSDFENEIAPYLSIAYRASAHITLFANGGNSFRYPTFTDLYYNIGGAVGSKDLKPESAFNLEAGARFRKNGLSVQVALFRRATDNLIDWIRHNSTSTTVAANITEAVFTGTDVVAAYNFKQSSGIIRADVIAAGISYIHSDTVSSGYESNYALDFLKMKITGSFVFRAGKHFYGTFLTSYQDRQGGYYSPGVGQEVAYKGFWMMDVKAGFKLKNVEFYAMCNNLFDTSYVDLGNVQQPGRWFSAGLVLTAK